MECYAGPAALTSISASSSSFGPTTEEKEKEEEEEEEEDDDDNRPTSPSCLLPRDHDRTVDARRNLPVPRGETLSMQAVASTSNRAAMRQYSVPDVKSVRDRRRLDEEWGEGLLKLKLTYPCATKESPRIVRKKYGRCSDKDQPEDSCCDQDHAGY